MATDLKNKIQTVKATTPDDAVLLELLQALEEDSHVSQRRLSERLGIALGLVNTYLRWCSAKGLVKIKNLPAKRYGYFLTPKGFLEKSSLLGRHIQQSFSLLRAAQEECTQIIEEFKDKNIKRIVLVGSGDLQDFTYMLAQNSGLDIIKAKKASAIGEFDALLITDMKASQATYNMIASQYPENLIYTFPLLKIYRETRNA